MKIVGTEVDCSFVSLYPRQFSDKLMTQDEYLFKILILMARKPELSASKLSSKRLQVFNEINCMKKLTFIFICKILGKKWSMYYTCAYM